MMVDRWIDVDKDVDRWLCVCGCEGQYGGPFHNQLLNWLEVMVDCWVMFLIRSCRCYRLMCFHNQMVD